MADLTDAAEALVLDFLTGAQAVTHTPPLKVALTTTLPTDSTPGTEVTGGSYARQNVTAAAGGATGTSNTGTIQFSGMPNCEVMGLELWSSDGTPRRILHGLLQPKQFTATAADDTITSAGHGLTDGARIVFKGDGTLPGGLTAGVRYFIRDVTANTFKVAATQGGSAIDLTSDGEGTLGVVKAVNDGDVFEFPAGDLDLTMD